MARVPRRIRERRIAEWIPFPRVLIVGNDDGLLEALRDNALGRDFELMDAASIPAPHARASVVIAIVRAKGEESVLSRGVAAIAELKEHLTDDAVRIVVSTNAATKAAPRSLARLIAPEVLHQVAAAAAAEAPRRGFRERSGRAAIAAAGVHVFRVGRMR